MPITITTNTDLVLVDKIDRNGKTNLERDEAIAYVESLLLGGFDRFVHFLNLDPSSLQGFTGSYLSELVGRELDFSQIAVFSDYLVVFLEEDFELVKEALLKLVIGKLIYGSTEELFSTVVLNTYCPFQAVPNFIPLSVIQKTADTSNIFIVEDFEEVSAEDSLTLVDVIGPVIQNEIPASGSSLNNPETEITFDLVDAAAGIQQSSIDLYVNGIQVVDDGVALSPSGFGQTFLTKVTDNLYQFRFIKDDPFGLYEEVNVSGIAIDEAVPANSGIFNYSFLTWDIEDLGATISGGPDLDAPFLANLFPIPSQTNIDPNEDIILEIHDLYTGVDEDSVTITVDGNVVVESGVIVPDYASTVVSGLVVERGFRYEIDPVESFDFDKEIVVEVEAADRFTVPNILSTSYSFRTVSDKHLVVSGLSVLVDGVYEYFGITDTQPTEDPTSFRVVFTDLTGSGINLSETYIQHNWETISGVVYTPVVSGATDSYYAEFDLDPYYAGQSTLLYHVEQAVSGTYSGSIAPYREVVDILQWGYEVCYHPDEDFEYDSNVRSCVRICDRGDYPKLGSYCRTFYTTPMYSRLLTASIIGLPVDPNSFIEASYVSNNTFFEYGKTLDIEIEAEDYDGNKLLFQWSFTIEESS